MGVTKGVTVVSAMGCVVGAGEQERRAHMHKAKTKPVALDCIAYLQIVFIGARLRAPAIGTRIIACRHDLIKNALLKAPPQFDHLLTLVLYSFVVNGSVHGRLSMCLKRTVTDAARNRNNNPFALKQAWLRVQKA
jgi:hypothetical protein